MASSNLVATVDVGQVQRHDKLLAASPQQQPSPQHDSDVVNVAGRSVGNQQLYLDVLTRIEEGLSAKRLNSYFAAATLFA